MRECIVTGTAIAVDLQDGTCEEPSTLNVHVERGTSLIICTLSGFTPNNP